MRTHPRLTQRAGSSYFVFRDHLAWWHEDFCAPTSSISDLSPFPCPRLSKSPARNELLGWEPRDLGSLDALELYLAAAQNSNQKSFAARKGIAAAEAVITISALTYDAPPPTSGNDKLSRIDSGQSQPVLRDRLRGTGYQMLRIQIHGGCKLSAASQSPKENVVATELI